MHPFSPQAVSCKDELGDLTSLIALLV